MKALRGQWGVHFLLQEHYASSTVPGARLLFLSSKVRWERKTCKQTMAALWLVMDTVGKL